MLCKKCNTVIMTTTFHVCCPFDENAGQYITIFLCEDCFNIYQRELLKIICPGFLEEDMTNKDILYG